MTILWLQSHICDSMTVTWYFPCSTLVIKEKKYKYWLSHFAKSWHYWDFNWPGLWEFVADYVRSCNICRRNKAHCHKPYGLLKQLPIPPQPWESISMDFIEQLPPLEGHTDILVMVDRLTKQALFILTIRSLNATMLAELFVRHVFSKHRVPSHVTSNQGMEFVFKFFRSLTNMLDTKLYFTSGCYLEANGQTDDGDQKVWSQNKGENCHDLANRLSHYFFSFSFSFNL